MKVFVSKEVLFKVFQVAFLAVLVTVCLALKQECRAGEPVTLVFGGDVNLDDDIEQSVITLGNGDYAFPWEHIGSFFKQADIALINLEQPITDKGTLNWMKVSPWFRASPLAMDSLKNFAGIDIINVANNHAFDYNRLGFEDSLRKLKSAGINYIGGGLTYNEAYDPVILEVKGKKIAFLGFTYVRYPNWAALPSYTYRNYTYPGCSGIAWLSQSALKRGIGIAKSNNADFIVVSMHWGHEYRLVADPSQQTFGRMAIDLGADLVIGHHPHVIQPMEVYKGKYIYYSLGNLIFDQSESYEAGVTRGLVLEVICGDGGITTVNEHFIKINETTWQPAFEPSL